MLRFVDEYRSRSGRLTRREWLRLGLLGGLSAGLGRSGLGRAAAGEAASPAAAGFGRAKSVILVFANGGQSQIDMWDPKPERPARRARGVSADRDRACPACSSASTCRRIARIADRCTVVRSMSHEDLDHGSAAYLALTGVLSRPPLGQSAAQPNDMPTYGAVLRRVRPSEPRFVSDAIH